MAKTDDGMFWMSFEDAMKHFIGINVVLAYNPVSVRKTPKTWFTVRKTFWFESGDESGVVDGMKADTMYKLVVHRPGKFFFSVHQQDRRVIGSLGYFDFGVSILQQVDNRKEKAFSCH